MKKSKVKEIIKNIIREIHQLNEWTSGVLEGYEMELDDLSLPGVSDERLVVAITNINYQMDEGTPERGEFSPAYKGAEASGSEIELGKIDIISLKLVDEHGQVVSEIDDLKILQPDQKNNLEMAVKEYIDINEDKIVSDILDQK